MYIYTGDARPDLASRPCRRIHQGYFRDVFPTGISSLGSRAVWDKKKFYLRVTSLPGDNPTPPCGPILDPTGERTEGVISLSLYIYIYIHIYMCIYIYIYI